MYELTASGLAINPNKIEMVLFTRRYKITKVPLARMVSIRLQIAVTVKYLALVLDRKFQFEVNTPVRARKALISLYSRRGAIGKRWGLSPKVGFWLYDTIVKPIMFYGAFEWWRD